MTTAELIGALVRKQLNDEAVAMLKVVTSGSHSAESEIEMFFGDKQTVDEVNDFAIRFAMLFR